VSIFEHGIFGNQYTTCGVAIALLLGCFVVYTPGLQVIAFVLGTATNEA